MFWHVRNSSISILQGSFLATNSAYSNPPHKKRTTDSPVYLCYITIYIYIYTYTSMCIYFYIYTYIYTHIIQIYPYVCMYIYIYILFIYIYRFIYIRCYIYICNYMCVIIIHTWKAAQRMSRRSMSCESMMAAWEAP